MSLSNMEQLRRADIIINAICQVGEIEYYDLLKYKRSVLFDSLRGVCCLLSWEYKIHPNKMKNLMMRSRSNVINQSKRYYNYLRTGDDITQRLYNRAKNIIETKI